MLQIYTSNPPSSHSQHSGTAWVFNRYVSPDYNAGAMTVVFISHSSKDRVVATQVHQRLRDAGYAALFLDFHKTDGIPGGRPWERELYLQLRKADAVVFLASKDSVIAPWCFAEVTIARSQGRPIFPLRLDDQAELALLEDAQWMNLAEGEAAYAQLIEGLRREGLDPVDSFAWDPMRSPYPGLEPFQQDDAAVFFGRDVKTKKLIALLQTTLQQPSGRFVAIIGPSGSGKSSLLRAGLLPRLARMPERWVVLPARFQAAIRLLPSRTAWRRRSPPS